MTDRELLERAARAVGLLPYLHKGEQVGWHRVGEPYASFAWRPLTDDGDALRLAVKLKIDLRFPQDCDMYVDAGDCDAYTQYLIDTDNDRAAATRRAIVRAAAAIGSAV